MAAHSVDPWSAPLVTPVRRGRRYWLEGSTRLMLVRDLRQPGRGCGRAACRESSVCASRRSSS